MHMSRRGFTLAGLLLVCLLVLHQLSTGTQCLSNGMTFMSTETLMLQAAMGGGSLSSTTTNTTTDSSTTPNTKAPQRKDHQQQRPIPLTELVSTNKPLECQRTRFQRVSDVVLDATLAYADDDADTNSQSSQSSQSQSQQRQRQRKIPRIIHTTSKSRCMPPAFRDNLRPWQNLTNHSFFFHDDDAVDRLLRQDWPEFPQILKALKCTISGAAKADLWRALVLWEYGGIYTDVDNALSAAFNATTIEATDDAFFIVETMGIPSQFFFAASPRHPVVYLLVTAIMHRLYELPDMYNQYVPYVTGPGALKVAFQHFMKAHPPHVRPGTVRLPSQKSSLNKVKAGIYTGLGNRSVTVVGSKRKPDEYIKRNAVAHKNQLYTHMGMRHFSREKLTATNESCWRRLYETEDAALTETVSAQSRPLW
jgi:mannosyltransferase OCH1-like enzyme